MCTFSLTPDLIIDDPYYFGNHDRLRIALYTLRHTMKKDGTLAVGGELFALAKGQTVTAAQAVADALKVSRDKVMRVWKRMEKAFLILIETLPSRAHNRSAPRTQITVCCQTKNGKLEDVYEEQNRTRFSTQSAHNPHSYKEKNLESRKEDSDSSLRSESCRSGGLKMPPIEPEEGDNGARPADPSLGRKPESTTQTESGGGTRSGCKKPKSPPPGYCTEFDEFWAACPARRGSKLKAYQSWWKLPEAERQLALEGAKAWKCNSVGKEAKYIPHVTTWLNGRRWETEAEISAEEAWERKWGHVNI